MHFFSKKNFKIAPTPNRLTNHHKNLVEAKYRFFFTSISNFIKIRSLEAELWLFKVWVRFSKKRYIWFLAKKIEKIIFRPPNFAWILLWPFGTYWKKRIKKIFSFAPVMAKKPKNWISKSTPNFQKKLIL